ncbi:conserved hypothetical protein [Bathymodiolus platifrons methanotrophic gill symbiont]|uniref:hypothetical protein n=1 Tax=Bathymodiolus platifrons methanotrophic gill symbiont TaxID=113268 RepID=UPI000B417332|nr:hypothetical protein [Bathymodiolus platifrons methanotrophic gill symbiont]GAW86970.1 conserved hypothetical protein [Bathymodiolus platifrons methanotrophic gill symbiont]GFO74990.1 hypothetical protein BPLS_P1954 [Bathymodiolus platifrons methanotrophic gill symbiont]
MQKELQKLLFKKFSALYSAKQETFHPIQFDCDDGWYCLAETLSELVVKRSLMIKVAKVVNKQGRLQFYFSNFEIKDRDFIAGATKMAFILSGIVCTECAEKGEMFNGNSITSRCPVHSGAALPFIKRRPIIELPISTDDIGKMWQSMIIKLYQQVQDNQKRKEMPEVVFTKFTTVNDTLHIEYTGGDEVTHGMVMFILAYALKIDKDTGQIITPQPEAFH